MRTFELQTRIRLPRPREEIFAFFADAQNLNLLTPEWLHFEILSPDTVEMREGTLLTYRLRLHGIPIRWQSEITVWDPPFRFVDEQIRGPYRLWVHTHRFVCQGAETVVKDHVRYATLGGSIVQRLFVGPDLERIFSYRHRALRALFCDTDQFSPA